MVQPLIYVTRKFIGLYQYACAISGAFDLNTPCCSLKMAGEFVTVVWHPQGHNYKNSAHYNGTLRLQTVQSQFPGAIGVDRNSHPMIFPRMQCLTT